MMKKIKDPNTGVIRFIPDENDLAMQRMSNEIKELKRKINLLEEKINEFERGDKR